MKFEVLDSRLLTPPSKTNLITSIMSDTSNFICSSVPPKPKRPIEEICKIESNEIVLHAINAIDNQNHLGSDDKNLNSTESG